MRDGPSPATEGTETFVELARTGGARVERIASRAVSGGAWYEQGWAEFVLLVAGGARLAFADGTEHALSPGDWVHLPAGCRHRVAWTDPTAETIWLAFHLPAGPG
ncbi:cupin domain-containing protein [Roseomonas eburnea]|uniref:Cupin domain-containing protein n=1 Tax=Neoroseomonas eburnea TaxID=1346889 RepID=A0A9X9XE35_9PROT|nr:cupin domain-containing protein [Neoroseomonas eburnea]MBR0681971.1 cupin domain-containing protein [Neoroseomonas eburnea]